MRGMQIDYDEEVGFAGVQKLYDLARYGRDRPFPLRGSFTHPHSPFVTTRHYRDLYDHDAIDMPEAPAIDVERMDVMSRRPFHAHEGGRGRSRNHIVDTMLDIDKLNRSGWIDQAP